MIEKIEISLSETQAEVLERLSKFNIHFHGMSKEQIIQEVVNSFIAKEQL